MRYEPGRPSVCREARGFSSLPQKFIITLGTSGGEIIHLVGVEDEMLTIINEIVGQPKELV